MKKTAELKLRHKSVTNKKKSYENTTWNLSEISSVPVLI